MSSALLLVLALGLALIGWGCASVGDQMTAGVDDYAQYRRVRTAETVERRLQASDRYLREMPHGRFRDQVRAWFESADAAYIERIRDDEVRLRAYLRLLPAGPHADEARACLADLVEMRRVKAARQAEFDGDVARIEAQLALAQEQRSAFVARFVRFVRHAATTRAWGEPTWELEPDFLVDWRLRSPPARCRGGRCVKTVVFDYAIPESREIAPRQAVMDVVVELQRGMVSQVMITGPELFSRIGEAGQLRPTPTGDVMARAQAITDVLALLEPVLEDAFPADRCSRQAVSPVVMLRECGGVRLRIVAPSAPEEDRIEVEPVTE